ncbi:hypothetical protein BJ165DRAFT_1608020 [Panaeolus papilionaceus]|nr:hypothetical protein BJ165DRAFT_1608020 [Panaeolus papilionaceus]
MPYYYYYYSIPVVLFIMFCCTAFYSLLCWPCITCCDYDVEAAPIFATPGFFGGYSVIDPMVIDSGDVGYGTDPLYTDYGDDDGYGAADSY